MLLPEELCEKVILKNFAILQWKHSWKIPLFEGLRTYEEQLIGKCLESLTILWGWCLKVGVIDTHLTFTFNHDVSLNALSNSAKIASIGPIFTKKD